MEPVVLQSFAFFCFVSPFLLVRRARSGAGSYPQAVTVGVSASFEDLVRWLTAMRRFRRVFHRGAPLKGPSCVVASSSVYNNVLGVQYNSRSTHTLRIQPRGLGGKRSTPPPLELSSCVLQQVLKHDDKVQVLYCPCGQMLHILGCDWRYIARVMYSVRLYMMRLLHVIYL